MERNSTNFPTQLLAQLQKVYDEYARLRAVLDASDESEGAPRTAACLAGILKYYQYLVHWYMTSFVGADSPGGASEGSGRPPDAPRGLLVYHLMGMGKTFEAVAVSLSAIGILDSGLPEAPRPRRVIVVASKTLHGNFDSNLEKFVLSMGFPEADGAGRLKKARAMISYVTMDAHNMAEQVVRATRVAQVDVARSADFGTKSSAAAGGRRRQASGQTANALDGMLLVVDEAHNFFRAIINSPAPTTNARRLYTMIMAARDLKIMFLTGTPASKHPFELVPCFNMLTGTDLLPPQYNNFAAHFIEGRRIKNRGYLANRLVGLVSYAGYDLPRSLTEQFSDEDARVDGGRPRRNALRRPPAGDFGTKSAADTPLPQPADPWWRPTFALRTPQMDDQGISPGPLFVGAGFLSRPDAMRPHRGRKNQTGRYVGLAWSENSGEYHCQKQIQEFYALHAELKNSFAAAHHSVTHNAHLPLIFSKLGQEYLRFIPQDAGPQVAPGPPPRSCRSSSGAGR